MQNQIQVVVKKKGFLAVVVLIVSPIVSIGYLPLFALDTGPVDPTIIPNRLSISVNIKLWGFDTPIFTNVMELPETIVQESRYPQQGIIDQYRENIHGYQFGWEYHLKYSYEEIANGETIISDFFESNAEVYSSGRTVNINGSLVSVTGRGMEISLFSKLLSAYDSDTGYTIHLIDGDFLDNFTFPYHWYFVSNQTDYFEGGADFRNVGSVNKTSLFYDVNAFAPAYSNVSNGSQRLKDTSSSLLELADFIAPRLVDLIEKIVIGSPYHNNYGFVDYSRLQKPHFSTIVLTDSANFPFGFQFFNQIEGERFISALQNLFSWYPTPIERVTSFINIDQEAEVKALLEKSELVNGTKGIIVTPAVAEEFKRVIRSTTSIYSTYPTGFFYLTLMLKLSDENDVTLYFETNNTLRPYDADYIGFNVEESSVWDELNLQQKLRFPTGDFALRSIGELVGLPILDNGISSFIETPMSKYGFGATAGGKEFSGLEILGYGRKVALWYNLSASILYSSTLHFLRSNRYEFIPHEELFDAEAVRLNATVFWRRGEYETSIKQYLIAYQNMTDAVSEVNKRINALGNSLIWGAGFFLLLSLNSFIKSYILPPKEKVELTANGIPKKWYENQE